ncbi:lambda exonuclease family protein [Bartonella sp. DGB1]|uniref:lambda exonuclease family protein n=1 Tax=Bartonella sp. DGB1 TaxID=3239807 RepID=UPI0035241E03
MQQNSAEWFQARLGKVTASRIYDIIASQKNGEPLKKYSDYKMQLLSERLTGQIFSQPTNKYMDWGVEYEAQAKEEYKFLNDVVITECGFINHPTIAMSGASPDGLINADGLIEVKCPQSTTHLDFLLNDKIKPEYIAQMQWQMACTDRAWCDFVSFDPRFEGKSAGLRIKEKRILRDDNFIAEITVKVSKFLQEIKDMETQLKETQ